MARHDVISKETERQIYSLLLDGWSMASVAKACGVSAKSVQVRKSELVRRGTNFGLCDCGRSRSHKGTCVSRVRRFRSGGPPHRVLERQRTKSPYAAHLTLLRSAVFPRSRESIAAYCEKVVPRTLPTDVRDDCRQELALRILSGLANKSNIEEHFCDCIQKSFEVARGAAFHVPLDMLVERNLKTGRMLDFLGARPAYDPDNNDGGWQGIIDSIVRVQRNSIFSGAAK